MLNVEEAFARILEVVRELPPDSVPLAEALGLVLAEEMLSDVDSPPFDKALMDGYALRAADVRQYNGRLHLVGEIAAGQVAKQKLQPGEALRIMTGAPLPGGADAVVRLEETRFEEETETVHIAAEDVSPGENMMQRGTSRRCGEAVLAAGSLLTPQKLGALAEMGQDRVPVRRRPQVAVLATGDELVPVAQTPGPGQIRNSNETMLTAQVCRAGGLPRPLGIARDRPAELQEKIADGLKADVLLLSGGVSAGKRDLVPAALSAAGVETVFHKVRLKPGKPLWFGIHRGPDNRSCCVFGLPGNPVSSMVCFELFVRTALRRLMGHPQPRPQTVPGRLQQDFSFSDERLTCFPCCWEVAAEGPRVSLVNWHGSADLQSTVEANGMVLLPPGSVEYRAGDVVQVILW